MIYRCRQPQPVALGGFRIDDRHYDSGRVVGEHQHDLASIVLVHNGTYVESEGDRERYVSPCSLLYKPPNAVHANDFAYSDPRCLVIEIEPDRLRDLARKVPLPRRSTCAVDPLFLRLSQSCLEATRSADSARLETTLLRMLETLSCTDGTASEPPWLATVERVLQQTNGRRHGVHGLAAIVRRNPSHLARAFRRYRGCTLGAYARSLKLHHAMERLRGSDAPLAIIADRCGFASQSHMGRTMRQLMGCTPRQFRHGPLTVA